MNDLTLKTMPLDVAGKAIARERRDTQDLYAPLSAVSLDLADPLAPPHLRYRVTLDHSACRAPLALTPTSLAQLARLTQVPPRLLEVAPPALGLSALRTMLAVTAEKRTRSYLFRLRGTRRALLRAVLPSNFVRLDDGAIYNELVRAVAGSELRIASLHISEDLLALRLLLPEDLNLGAFGGRRFDLGHAGVDVRSSETGRFPLEVRELLFRVVCRNGMTQLTESQGTRIWQHGLLDRERLQRMLRAALENALPASRHMARRLADSRLEYIADPQAEVQRVFARYRLGSPRSRVAGWVRQELAPQISLLGVRRFDVVQAFTAVARRLDHDQRPRYEDAMGDYVMTN